MNRVKTAAVLLAMGCAVFQGQQGAAPASGLMFAGPAKDGKVPRPPDCPAKFDDSLETNGIAPMGKVAGVTPPKPLYTPDAELSDKARREMHKRGGPQESMSVLVFVVDRDGTTKDLCVKRSAEFDLDQQAARAVLQYRFEPAKKDGEPVPQRVTVNTWFRVR